MTKTHSAVVALSILLTAGACTAARLRTEGPDDRTAPRHEEQSATQDAPLTSVRDGVYTETQAKRGAANYLEACARCHSRRRRVSVEDRHGRPFLDDFAPELLQAELACDLK